MIGVYKFTNKFDRKVYVGKSKNIEKRYNAHLKASIKDNTYFHKALRKYGADNFDFNVLIECPIENLNYWEKFYIKYYCSNNRKYGYNMTDGGDGVSFWSDELREKQSKILSKPRPYRVGLQWTEEQKQNKSKIQKKYYECHPDQKEILSKIAIKKFEEHPELKERCAACLGRIKVNNGIVEKTISKDELEEYLNKGFVRGRLSTINYKSNSLQLKDFYKNNPDALKRCAACLGRIKVNNGIVEKTIPKNDLQHYLDDGFVKGRLPFKTK